MKRLLLILIAAFAFAEAKPCMTDIYFGNGVWNTRSQAIESRDTLRNFLLNQAATRLDAQKEGVEFQFKYAYNPSHGRIEDLIETFWQLKESGQIGVGYFTFITTQLNGGPMSPSYLPRLIFMISHHTQDVSTMLTLYRNESFSKHHNVLLVAHSQGNLFGNKMYALLSDEQKARFRMVSVGTPADHVMRPGQKEPYTTLKGDLVIKQIPGALPGREEGWGHTFVGAYLKHAPEKIARDIKNTYDEMMQNTDCAECSIVRTKVSEINKMTVECQVLGTYKTEELGTFRAQKYAAFLLPDGSRGCRGSFKYAGFPNLIYTNKEGLYDWRTGHFTSKDQLKNRKGTQETYLYHEHGQCVVLSVGGDYYELVKSALAH